MIRRQAKARGRSAKDHSAAHRAVAAALATLLAVAGFTVGVAPVAAPPAAAASTGCGYANSSANNGKYASTICWFDFTAFDETTARQDSGQPLQITLDGGLVASFIVKVTKVGTTPLMSFEKRSTPLETRFAFGTDAYRGIPGLNALYSLAAPAGLKAAKISFDNIQVTDAQGHPVAGYSFIAADAEDNVSGESFAWNSDKPLKEIERLAPNGGWGCKNPVGMGTTSVTCAGTGSGGTTIAGGKSTALLVAADSPTSFATTWATGARSAIAIGVQTAKLTVTKQVTSRIAGADAFTVTATNSSGTVVGQASTGTSASATTGALVVAPGGTYTVGETAAAGSPADLANYAPSWSCVNMAATSPTVLPSGPGLTQTVVPAAGDDIVCTVTNTAKSTGISLQKIAAPPVDVNGNGITDAGDTIAYSFQVTNVGQTDIETVAIADNKVSTVTCPAGPVAPTASVTCTADDPYLITAADVTAGAVVNTATATAHPLGSATILTSNPSSTSTPTVAPAPALKLTKSASPSTSASYVAGQLITYSFVVRNTGNVPVDGITIDDSTFTGTGTLSALDCPAGFGTLAPNSEATCNATYTLTQPDVNAGQLSNSATATGVPNGGPATVTTAPSGAVIPIDPAAAVTLTKRANPSTAEFPGDVITYEFDVTNSGNVTLSDAAITETAFSGTGGHPAPACPPGSFIPGQTITCTAAYTLTQADVNAGTVTNTATASATAPSGPNPVSAASTATVIIAADPSLALVKTAAVAGSGVAGDVVTYSFVATNTGNVTLTGVAIDETAFSGTGSLTGIVCPDPTLDAGESTTCTATYPLTQADVNAGSVTNTAVATATPVGTSADIVSLPAQAVVATRSEAGITLQKSASPGSAASAGTVVTYSFVVTNTGTVDLANPSVDETAFTGAGTPPTVTCPPALLHPAGTATCTALYTLTQADVDAGSVANTATATATAPSGIAAPVSASSSATVTIAPAPALTLVKSASPSTAADFTVGQVVTYSFAVTNTGNVTLTDVVVTEGSFTGTGTLPPATCPAGAAVLAPGQQVVCTAEYTLTQDDIDAGSVTNAATATADPPGTTLPPVSPGSSVTIPELAKPALSMVKTTPTTAITTAGQVVGYTFTITNTGNTTLSDPKAVEGSFSGTGKMSAPDCPAVPLVPGATTVCTASYTVQLADLTGEPLVNTAIASATDPGGATVGSAPSTARITDVVAAPIAAQPTPSGLASTGLAVGGSVAAAAILLLSGLALVFARRRRRLLA
ncbi:beta strand repeat-containing protein [Leifsonia sp. NPDC014704]|uniref:beta strand repeat-containing protein n=1 Tax=Leifsonia sp. NPDC014704 TaxID=3364123 RepID=UPI0036F491D5